MQPTRTLFGCQVFDPSDVLDGWECEPLGQRIELAYGRALRADQRAPGDIAVFGSNGPVGTHSTALSEGPGILVGRKGSVGAVHFADGPFWAIDTVYYVVPKRADCLKFLYYLLQYLPLKNLNAATGVPGLSRRDVYALRGVFPPKQNQEAIARVLSAVDRSIVTVAGMEGLHVAQAPLFGDVLPQQSGAPTKSSKLDAMIDLRRCLMHAMLTGANIGPIAISGRQV